MVIPFKVVQGDGTTVKNLTGITVRWYFKDRDGNAPTGSPITGSVTDAANGLVEFTIPSGMFTTATKFKAQLNLSDGVNYEEDTEWFNVDVDDRAKP